MNKYNNLSMEEMIKLLEEKDKQIEKEKNKNKKITEKYDKAIIDLRDTRILLEKYIAKYGNLEQRLLRDTYNKFVGTKELNEDIIINEAEEKATIKRGRKENSKNFSTTITPTRTIEIDLDEEEKICPNCGEKLVYFDDDRTIKIIRHPAFYEAVEILTKKYKCANKDCEFGIKQKENKDSFPHSPITASIAADIINMKYNLGVPLDRYSKYLISEHINISTQDLSNYVIRSADLLEPIYEKIKYELTHNQANVIHADETTLKVLDIKEKQNCYMFVYTTSFYDNSIYLYDFSETRKTDKTSELLKDFKGYLVCDKYSGYNRFKDQLKGIQRCMAHARRYFFDVVKTLNNEQRKKSKAKVVVDLIDKIFKYEAEMKKAKITVPEIKEKRNSKEYQKLIDDLKNYVWQIEAVPGSLLDKAVGYMKGAWDELFTYRESGYVDISNNIAERAVKPFVIARKNFLFSKTENGAQASGLLFSIIQTAKANGLIIDKYLEYIIDNINKANIDELLPWSEKLPKDLKIKF